MKRISTSALITLAILVFTSSIARAQQQDVRIEQGTQDQSSASDNVRLRISPDVSTEPAVRLDPPVGPPVLTWQPGDPVGVDVEDPARLRIAFTTCSVSSAISCSNSTNGAVGELVDVSIALENLNGVGACSSNARITNGSGSTLILFSHSTVDRASDLNYPLPVHVSLDAADELELFIVRRGGATCTGTAYFRYIEH
jgi:hypothetical protein